MELIRQAANAAGDYVVFQRISDKQEILYRVYAYNSKTACSLVAYSTAMSADALGRKYLERDAQIAGMSVFEEACEFMGLELPEVDEQ